jgi:Flp pilus assembly protein TadB
MAYGLMTTFLVISAGAGLVSLFIIRLIPVWVLGLVGGVTLILLARPLLRFRRDRSLIAAQAQFHKPLEIATAVALAAQVTVPWLNSIIHWRAIQFWLHF